MVNIFVAVTDYEWFLYLQARPTFDSINFWQPGGQTTFRALKVGELFLFKLHAPRNFIVGGGIFSHATIIPISLAWEAFGEANGAESIDKMKIRIAHYRREDEDFRKDFKIGCRILEQPFFFDESLWIPMPKSWAPNIVSGRRYNTDDVEGRQLWEELQSRLFSQHVSLAEDQAPYGNEGDYILDGISH